MAIAMSALRTPRAPALMRMLARPNQQPVRLAGHGRTLRIYPSLFSWNKFKDMAHLYTMVAFIPWAIAASYCNIFIGSADLAEIPEGYEPEYYEYERNPITRFFCRHMFEHPAANHERKLHVINILQEKKMLKDIEKQVRKVMSVRNDYRAWTFIDADAKYERRWREASHRAGEMIGVSRLNDIDETPDPRT